MIVWVSARTLVITSLPVDAGSLRNYTAKPRGRGDLIGDPRRSRRSRPLAQLVHLPLHLVEALAIGRRAGLFPALRASRSGCLGSPTSSGRLGDDPACTAE